MIWKVLVAYEAPSAASAAAVVRRKLEGRHRGGSFAVIRVEDQDGAVHWRQPEERNNRRPAP